MEWESEPAQSAAAPAAPWESPAEVPAEDLAPLDELEDLDELEEFEPDDLPPGGAVPSAEFLDDEPSEEISALELPPSVEAFNESEMLDEYQPEFAAQDEETDDVAAEDQRSMSCQNWNSTICRQPKRLPQRNRSTMSLPTKSRGWNFHPQRK